MDKMIGGSRRRGCLIWSEMSLSFQTPTVESDNPKRQEHQQPAILYRSCACVCVCVWVGGWMAGWVGVTRVLGTYECPVSPRRE